MIPERRLVYISKLPAALRAMLDEELAAGNEVNDVEVGHGDDEGKFAVALEQPFRVARESPPSGVFYRVIDGPRVESFQYHTADESCMLVVVKFKPMKFEKLGPGPSDPTEAHIKRMNQRNSEMKSAEAKRVETENVPVVQPPVDLSKLDPASRFLASMTMTFDMWHDGLGYDLAALKEVSREELKSIEQTLVRHEPRDWRDIEALAQIDTPTARAAVEAALTSREPIVRQTAQRYAGKAPDPAEREALLVKSLNEDVLYGGLTQAIDEVPEFHPPAVVEALFRGALHRDGEVAVHFAALLMFLHGKAKEPFDWDHRPFFLRFNTGDQTERRAVFAELCERIGADSQKYLR